MDSALYTPRIYGMVSDGYEKYFKIWELKKRIFSFEKFDFIDQRSLLNDSTQCLYATPSSPLVRAAECLLTRA